jgi:16S rRNA processing protein RimM
LAHIPPTVTTKGILENEWNELIGYCIMQEEKVVGIVDLIHENSMQQLFEIKAGDQLIHIPIQESFIEKIDDANKIIKVSLPEGYLEIFTQ